MNECKICGEQHDQQSGFLTRHIQEVHGLTLEDYVIKTEYNNVSPICKCGYCNERPNFYRGKFKNYAIGHQEYSYIKEQFIKLNGIPKCPTCDKDILKWNRGKPNKYCNIKCKPGTFNQEKIKKTVQNKYNVDNVFQVDKVKDKIKKTVQNKYGVDYVTQSDIVKKKMLKTIKDRYGVNHVMYLDKFKNKLKKTMQERYGVSSASQMYKNRIASSKRMIKFNKNWFKNIRIKKYKDTDLYYQSSYELEFLELCEANNIIDRISNGNSYKYLTKEFGHYLLTDFCIDNIEIEIKSSYILKKQGGMQVLNAKREAVESAGKRYMFLLDKDHSEFLQYINKC